MKKERVEKALTHIDAAGRIKMVDVSKKEKTWREAIARGKVAMRAETLDLIMSGKTKKGNVLETARIAGIMAAKKTSDLIPLCHPIPLSNVEISFNPKSASNMIQIESRVKAFDRTGVEMEALVAVVHAALTIYDMCKAVDRGMTISDIELLFKTGGKSGTFQREKPGAEIKTNGE